MHDRPEVPKVSPPSVFALFADLPAARIALEALLQGGFHGEQLGWIKGDDSIFSPANDLATYRSTGLADSPSSLDRPFAGDDPAALEERERELALLREHAIVISVAPGAGQHQHARDLLTALGGRLLRADGSPEEAAA